MNNEDKDKIKYITEELIYSKVDEKILNDYIHEKTLQKLRLKTIIEALNDDELYSKITKLELFKQDLRRLCINELKDSPQVINTINFEESIETAARKKIYMENIKEELEKMKKRGL